MPTLNGLDAAAIERAADCLSAGELVGIPTETVYGLAARADDDRAVARIYAAKGRPPQHPLIVHVLDAQAAKFFVEPPSATAQRLMTAFWPGPVSLVLQRRPGVATAAAGGLPTVALRCPSHPVAQALLRRCLVLGVPGLAAPSANRFGKVSPTRAEHVRDEMGADLLVLDGAACEAGIESAIIDCTSEVPRLLRPGHVPRATLEAALGLALQQPVAASPRVSGSLDSHYAPTAQVSLCSAAQLPTHVAELQARFGAEAVALWSRRSGSAPRPPVRHWSVMPDNAGDAAHQLFNTLRRWDVSGVKAICVEMPPDEPAWEGVLDRLRRAAAPR